MHNLEKRLSVKALLDEVDRLLEEGLPEGTAPVAAFDADGTLWSGDIGETAFCAGFRASPQPFVVPRARRVLIEARHLEAAMASERIGLLAPAE